MINTQVMTDHVFQTMSMTELEKLCQHVVDRLGSYQFDRLVSFDLYPLALTSLVSVASQKPFVIVRQQAKGYGTNKLIEGYYEKGERLLMLTPYFSEAVDTVITSLSSSQLHTVACFSFLDNGFSLQSNVIGEQLG